MKKVIIKLLSFAVVIGALAWFLWNPEGWQFEWEPLLLFLAAIATFLGIEGYESKIITPAVENDTTLFNKLLTDLPLDDTIEFIKNHDFGGMFTREQVQPLYDFVHYWDNPEHEFNDPTVEKLRKAFFESATTLSSTIAKNTAPNNKGYISVLPDHERGGPRPEWVIRDAKEINNAANVFIEKHTNLIKAGRKKLRIKKHLTN